MLLDTFYTPLLKTGTYYGNMCSERRPEHLSDQ